MFWGAAVPLPQIEFFGAPTQLFVAALQGRSERDSSADANDCAEAAEVPSLRPQVPPLALGISLGDATPQARPVAPLPNPPTLSKPVAPPPPIPAAMPMVQPAQLVAPQPRPVRHQPQSQAQPGPEPQRPASAERAWSGDARARRVMIR